MATHMLRKCLRQGCRRVSRHQARKFSSSDGASSSSVTTTPMSERPDGFPVPNFADLDKSKYETQVTTLENGLRVASQKQFGQFCSVGVVIDSGSRYEVNFPSGISHFLEKLAFTKTRHYADKDKMHVDLESVGGICDCQGSRDTLIYAISSLTSGLPVAMNILSEVVNQPVIEEESKRYRDTLIYAISSLTSGLPVAMNILSEVVNQPVIEEETLNFARTTVGFELEAHRYNPAPDTLLTEQLFAAAYRNNTLGLPKLCPTDNINTIDIKTLYTYMKLFQEPSRMVLSGVGMEHDELVRLAQEYFVDKKPIWEDKPDLVIAGKEWDNSIAQYTGGIVTEEADLSSVGLSLTQMPELAHFVIGLESCSHKDPDFVAYCVLNMMMGGGGSFSAGGPGKGMYTRLYTNVLNCYHWVNSATAYNHAYEDTGVFCIHSSCPPDILHCLVDVITKEVVATAGFVRKDELNRAKTQLQSMLLMNLEQRPVVFEDIGRQVLSQGHRKPPEFYYDQIAQINAKDIQRVAERMLKTKPSVAAYGKIDRLQTLEQIQGKLLERPDKTLTNKLRSMF